MSNGVWHKTVQESDPNTQAVQPFGGALGESGSAQHLASHWANCGLHHCFHCEQSLLSLDRLEGLNAERRALQKVPPANVGRTEPTSLIPEKQDALVIRTPLMQR